MNGLKKKGRILSRTENQESDQIKILNHPRGQNVTALSFESIFLSIRFLQIHFINFSLKIVLSEYMKITPKRNEGVKNNSPSF